jgi:L-amino acid N-acyltransferase YncA
VELRIATRDDASAVAEIYAPIVASSPISFELDPPDEQEMRRRIEATLAAYPWVVCEHERQVVGYAYATGHGTRAGYQWSVNTSVYVHRAFHRRGIGRALYRSLFNLLAAQGFVNAYAGITLPNDGSVGLHESTGFRPVGVYRHSGYKNGQWYDVGWWQRPLRPLPTVPQRPRTLDEVLGDGSWHTTFPNDQWPEDDSTDRFLLN